MKTKILLTKDQVDKLVASDEKQLRAKFEKDLAVIRKKYQFVEIDIETPIKAPKSDKKKLSDELFNQYWKEGKKVKEIAELSGYNEGYVYRLKKRLIADEK